MNSIWIGFDPRETAAFAVCRQALRERLTKEIPIHGLTLENLKGVYSRPTEIRKSACDNPILWDCISEAPMSTEFAISRFFVPYLAKSGWALFMDCDMLPVADFSELFDICDPHYAVMCVNHKYETKQSTKMDGQVQTTYPKKNWSSVMAFNCDHPANKALTLDALNTLPGRDLHRFCWLDDSEIGKLDPGWNWLVGEQDEPVDLKNIHYTTGGPWFHGYENVPYADQWRQALNRWTQYNNEFSTSEKIARIMKAGLTEQEISQSSQCNLYATAHR